MANEINLSGLADRGKRVEVLSVKDFFQSSPIGPLIDVRSPEEFNKAHILRAISITQSGELLHKRII